MKKLVSLALVALLLCGAVAFADPSEIQITNYSAGDVGGVYSSQIDRAISSGGELVGMLPELPWQKGAQVGTFLDKMNQLLTPDDVEAEVEVDDGMWGLTPDKLWDGGKDLDELADIIVLLRAAALAEGWDYIGGFFNVGGSTYFVDEYDNPVKVVKEAKTGNYVYTDPNDPTNKKVWIPGTAANDPGKLETYQYGGVNPDTLPSPAGVDFTKGTVPVYVKDGFYKDATSGDVYKVVNGVTTKYATLTAAAAGVTGLYATVDGKSLWNGAAWVARKGSTTNPAEALAKTPTNGDPNGYYDPKGTGTTASDTLVYWSNKTGVSKSYSVDDTTVGTLDNANISVGTTVAPTAEVYWSSARNRFEVLSDTGALYSVVWVGTAGTTAPGDGKWVIDVVV